MPLAPALSWRAEVQHLGGKRPHHRIGANIKECTRSCGSRRVTLILSCHPLSFETPASRAPQDEGDCEGRDAPHHEDRTTERSRHPLCPDVRTLETRGARGGVAILVNVMAVVLACAVIAVTADLFRMAGLSLYTEQYLAGLMALAMPLLYLHVPAGGRRGVRSGPVPWYDLVAAAVSFVAMIYVAIRFPALSELVSARPWDGLIVAAVVIALILEGLRRTTGMGLFYTTIFFFVLALVGGSLPGEFAAKSIPLPRLTYYSVWDSTAVMGVTLKIVATVVVIFVLFGHVLFKSGGAGFFTDISMALMGRRRGGPAKIAILGSSLFGTISGNVVRM